MDSPRQRIIVLIATLAALALPLIATTLAMPDLITLGTQIAIYAIAAVSLDLLIGYTGLSSFGHAAFFGLGAYVVAILATTAAQDERLWGLIPGATQAWIVWPAAIAASALAALAIGALCLRTSGVQFIMITLAFAEMLYFLFVSLKTYGGDDGLGFRRRNAIPWINPRDDTAFYYVCLAALILFLLLCRRIVRSRFGLVLQGIRQNERRWRPSASPPIATNSPPSSSPAPEPASPARSTPISCASSAPTCCTGAPPVTSWSWWSSAAPEPCSARFSAQP
jgi:branched-chain amino acid transport system permease protein